jgi:hypothetical protein
MQIHSHMACSETARERAIPHHLPPCPVCSEPLLDLRGVLRCRRCQFSICTSCDGWDVCPGAEGIAESSSF